MTNHMMIILSTMAFCVVGNSSQAMAQFDAAATQKVPYSDLDLANEADLKKLESRIKSAVRVVCRDSFGRYMNGHSEYTRCEDQAMQLAEIEKNKAIQKQQARFVATKNNRVVVGN
jgi:UrcA family protein